MFDRWKIFFIDLWHSLDEKLILHKKSVFFGLASFFSIIVLGIFSWNFMKVLFLSDPISQELVGYEKAGSAVLDDLRRIPAVNFSEKEKGYSVSDDTGKGIEITYAGKESEEKKDNLEITFPKDYLQPVEIRMEGENVITMTDNGNQENMSLELLADDAADPLEDIPNQKSRDKKETDPQKKYLLYKIGRKKIFYTYQKDQATGESLLKNWIIYANGNGQEKESYTFQNAKMKKNDRGEVEIYYFGDMQKQTQQAMQDVDQSLLERAQKVIQQDAGQDILNSGAPSIIIPKPYFLDKDGNRHEAEWTVNDEMSTIELEIKVENISQYPLALDPTLSFTAPGQSNSGTVINGELSSYLGTSLSAGDFNDDGRTDLIVGAYGYSSTTGRVYIFYNDGDITSNGAYADAIITGETTSNSFGISLSVGDFNSDGKTDLAVGGADIYSSNTGRVYIFHNDGSIPTTAASADVVITGEASSYFGHALSAGDFNADGTTDLAVGAYLYSSNTGRVYIFLSDGSIPTTAASADVIITGETTNNNFGCSLVSGDFNTDGRIDLAVGAWKYSSDTGRVYIFLSDGSIPTAAASADVIISGASNTSFGTSINAGDFNADGTTDLVIGGDYYSSNDGRVYIFYNDGSIPTSAASADVTITGESDSVFGRRLSVGDFNDDGRTDLAVGAELYSSNDVGCVYIFLNDGSIPTSATSADIIIVGQAADSLFGRTVVAGDFNSDGKTDLAVGAEGYSSNAGRVYIFYSQNDQINTNFNITGETGSGFGNSIVAGDFNSDGKTDLAVGAYYYSTNTGRTYIFLSDGTITTAFSSAASADIIITGEATSNYFGSSLSAGDFNADGKTDLAVGAEGYSTNTGRVYIFHNDGSIPTSAASADVIITGETTNNYFGDCLFQTDFYIDGKTDLVVGAYNYNSTVGRAYIFYNDGSIPTSATSADFIITGEGSDDLFGTSFAAGDFNSDGKIDLVVGAPNRGRAYVFYNDTSIPTAAASADIIITGGASERFGNSVVAADLNNDGTTDIIVAAYYLGLGHNGRVFVFYNDGSIPTADSDADVKITGPTNEYFGNAMVVGDFNSDGKTDLAASANHYSSTVGRTYIFYNFYNKGSFTADSVSADVIITGEAADDYFGSFLAIGDFNSDGKTDLAVGVNNYSSSTGCVYIYETRNNYAWQLQPQNSIRTNPISGQEMKITGETVNNYFSFSMVSADFNADGKTDLATGAYGYSSNTGRAYIFLNDGSITTAAVSADIVITGEASSYFGLSLTAGDFNADGKVDLAAGAWTYSTNAGRVYIFHNDGSIPTSAASADVIIDGEASSRFGYTISAGDFNADGKTDLVVGAYGYSSYAGRAYIFHNDGSIPTSAASADVIIDGEASSRFGISFSAGDFNSDGKIDLVAGAYGYSSYAGRAYIFHNDGSIPTSAASADFIVTGEASSYFGRSVIVADFNSDGKNDLVVGAYGYSTTTGRAYIFYNDGSMPTAATSADVIITGEAESNCFGYSLAVADFNSDGKTDLTVGAYAYSSSTGRAYIFYSDGSIPTAAASADLILTGETGSRFGTSFAVGDFNSDGKPDLAIGGHYYSSNTGRIYIYTFNDYTITGSGYFGLALIAGDFNADGKTDLATGSYSYSSYAGRAYIFYNDGSMPTAATSADVIIDGEASSRFGYRLTAGDFNADGKTDLAIGAFSYSSYAGRAYIFHNDGSIPTSAASADVIIDGEAGSYFSSYLVAGDFNADGKTDLSIGAYVYATNTGRVYIFSNDGSIPTSAASADVIIDGEAQGDYLGWSLTAGDFNADGKTDLVAGAYGYSYNGRAYIFLNDGSIPTSAASADVIITGQSGTYLSYSLSAGDFNADGRTDLVAGAFNYSSNTGRAYIFLNDGFIPTDAASADVIIDGETSAASRFSISLSAGDFNADGKTDLAVGAYFYSTNTGRVYIFSNDGSIPTSASSADAIMNGEAENDYFGYSLSAGDFNSDGKTDLAVGAYGKNRVYIYISESKVAERITAKFRGTAKLRGTVKFR